jgi:NAD(P)-dependent dehydrogenase (short-subunit alcohol dehydrogenase family)
MSYDTTQVGSTPPQSSATVEHATEVLGNHTFAGKVVVVTGAASGLGLGIASRLSQFGAFVVAIDNDGQRLEAAISANLVAPHELSMVDVTNYNELESVINGVYAQHGRIDYLFNNAGIGGTLAFEQATLSHWHKIIDLNLYGVIHGMTAVYPLMKRQRFGHIINTSSISGLVPVAGQALYNATKFAVTGLSLSLVAEFENDNIYISIACPGMVQTRIFYKPILGAEAPEDQVVIPSDAISVDEAVEDIIEGVALRRRVIITPKGLEHYYEQNIPFR